MIYEWINEIAVTGESKIVAGRSFMIIRDFELGDIDEMVEVHCISLYITYRPIVRWGENMKAILHEPQLDTILMVEKAIKDAKSYPTRKELWNSLPKKVQYQTFKRILDYLESSNKIVFNNRKIVWVFPDNYKLKKLLESSVKLR